MKQVLDFIISKNANTLQTASFTVQSSCPAISISHDLPGMLPLAVSIVIEDSHKNIRFHKQLGYSENVIGLGICTENTTIGGIPGLIESGMWKIKVYISPEFFEGYASYLGDKEVRFSLTIKDKLAKITEHLGTTIWANKKFEYTGFDYSKNYDIYPHSMNTRWYKGDFHAHTRLSDGKETPERVTEKSKMMNLDFYTTTEHNVMHTGWPDTDMLIMPGIEITTLLGHANLFGLRNRPDFLDDVLVAVDEAAQRKVWESAVSWCRQHNVLLSINHPFLYKWKWKYGDISLEDVSCLEIINDPTYESVEEAHAKEANQLAVRMSDMLWADGYRICAIGGSDSHNRIEEFYDGATEPSIAGDPATWIFSDTLSVDNICNGLRKCHACVTRYIDEMTLEFQVGNHNFLPGDRIDNNIAASKSKEKNYVMETTRDKIVWNIVIKSSRKVPHLFELINGVREDLELDEQSAGVYTAKGEIIPPNTEYGWVRFGAEDNHGDFMMYENPITWGERKHEFKTFNDINLKIHKDS